MNTRTRNLSILLAATVSLVLAGRARASTCTTNATATDSALFNVHGCRPDYSTWQYQRYDLRYDDWNDKGWYDACNSQVVYPKHWNATYLIDYAIWAGGPWWNPTGRPFHYVDDYGGMVEHSSSGYHDALRHLMSGYSGSRNLLGLFSQQYNGSPNRLQTFCEDYDATNGNATVDQRAAVMVHEGTHGWYHKNGTNGGNCGGHHCPGEIWPISASPFCTLGTCDFFYFHGAEKYSEGSLWYQDDNQGRGQYFHSPFQTEIEFLCDLADFGADWLPQSIVVDAATRARSWGTSAIINGPGFGCGEQRPW